VGPIMSPVGESGRPAGLRWHAPLSLDANELGVWARSTAIAFIGNAELTAVHRQALLGWRGLVEILPNRELGPVKTPRGPVRTIASLQQLLDEDATVISRLVGPPVREAFEAMGRRKAWAERKAREAEEAANAEAAAAEAEAKAEADLQAAVEAELQAALLEVDREAKMAGLASILQEYGPQVEAAKEWLSLEDAARREAAKAADRANSAILAEDPQVNVLRAVRAGNQKLAAAWALIKHSSGSRRNAAIAELRDLDGRFQKVAYRKSAMLRALTGACRGLLNPELAQEASIEFSAHTESVEEGSSIPQIRKAGVAIPGWVAPPAKTKKAAVYAAAHWFDHLLEKVANL